MKRYLKYISVLLVTLLFMYAAATPASAEEPDRMQRVLMSLAVPGLGQYMAGSYGYAKLFFMNELLLLGAYYYNSALKDSRRDDYLNYAALHAGANLSKYGTSYTNAVGAYNSSFEHNAYMSQRSTNVTYYSGVMSWDWDDEASRLRFRNLRERELDYDNYMTYCIAGTVLNHLLSALHASKLTTADETAGSAVSVDVYNDGLGARITRSF